MPPTRRVGAILLLAAKRLLSQRSLALATALGLLVAVALTASIPLYTDAVYSRLLQESLTPGSQPGLPSQPPFAFLFRYTGDWSRPLQWEETVPVNAYLTGSAGRQLGLSQTLFVRQFKSDTFSLFPHTDAAYTDTKQPLLWIRFACQSDVAQHITLVEGSFPAATAGSPDGPIEVMVSETIAQKLGFQVGEKYVTFNPRANTAVRQIPVIIAGVWKATNPEEPYWFVSPSGLNEALLVSEETFSGQISQVLEDEVSTATWYLLMDGKSVHAGNVSDLLGRITAVRQHAVSLLPKIALESNPTEALRKYNQAAGLLTIQLYAFCVPILGLILAFISLVAELTVSQQRNEMAILRSRGATALQVIGITLLEGGILGVLAVIAGVPGGGLVALLIGRARSFLDFGGQVSLPVRFGFSAFVAGLGAVGVVLVVLAVPLLGAARHTIVTYKQERARTLRPPFWRRFGLDFLLLAIFRYGVYLLRQQGSIVLPLNAGVLTNDPFQNPLLFFIPGLGVLALALLLLRLLPTLMQGIAWIAMHTPSVGLLMAARHLARTPGFYATPLVLLVLTLSLSTFTASLARTLERHLVDRTYYQIGADANLDEMGDQNTPTEIASPGGSSIDGSANGEPGWFFLPVSEHLKLPGVQAVTRVGRYPAAAHLSSGIQQGSFLGLDRVDFPTVAFWRQDFSPDSLGALMNSLALDPDGILVSQAFLNRSGLRISDPLILTVETFGQQNELEFRIAGVFNLFPTWYPDEGPLFVGNLDALFERAGGEFPYQVWLKTHPQINRSQVDERLRGLLLRVLNWEDARARIAAEQQRPDRQGMFGVLWVGFGAAALLTVLGFFLYALFSFRWRFIELGVLRAVGLSLNQMASFLAWELAFLLLTGLAVGTGLGIWISRLFIPYLQIGGELTSHIPSFQVIIDWGAVLRFYALFVLLFIAALAVLVAALLHMKIFQAVKLGEAA